MQSAHIIAYCLSNVAGKTGKTPLPGLVLDVRFILILNQARNLYHIHLTLTQWIMLADWFLEENFSIYFLKGNVGEHHRLLIRLMKPTTGFQ